jgi:twitching motility protein PilI
VVPLPQLTPAPLTKPWFAGIANIRGVLYSVVDFASWRGGAPTPDQCPVAPVAGRRTTRNQQRPAGTPRPRTAATDGNARAGAGAPDGGDDAAPWLGGRFTDAQDLSWTQLRIPALLADPNYIDIAL